MKQCVWCDCEITGRVLMVPAKEAARFFVAIPFCSLDHVGEHAHWRREVVQGRIPKAELNRVKKVWHTIRTTEQTKARILRTKRRIKKAVLA